MAHSDPALMDDVFATLVPNLGRGAKQDVYFSEDTPLGHVTLWSALIPEDRVAAALSQPAWDLLIGRHGPGFIMSTENGEQIAAYFSGVESGEVRPFVLQRDFHGARPGYGEVCEEFRLYHNLAADPLHHRLLDFDESGHEIEVVKFDDGRITVRNSYLRQFLAGSGFHLALYFEVTRFSDRPTEALGGEITRRHEDESSNYHYTLRTCDWSEKWKSVGRVVGKVMVRPPPKTEAGIWPFKVGEDQSVEFIVGVDDEGHPIYHDSDPDGLANYFGANPHAAHYLTPVFFRREVLSKYYADPDRYSVSDSRLECMALWQLRIDNNHATHVVVFLGDLGRDLPYRERLHWKQYEVAPEGSISDVYYARSIRGQFADPEAADLLFRYRLKRTQTAWRDSMGWDLFLEPTDGDRHLQTSIRIPVTRSASELDDLISAMTKLIVDSLNEKAIADRLDARLSGEKGISKLERWLTQEACEQRSTIIGFLRDLQELRSRGTAHRKGAGFEETMARLGLKDREPREIAEELLNRGCEVLKHLESFAQRG